ncbi:MAG: phosphoribosylanthranilate isomerase [Acidobacteriales bacterium]|nr:phosphoribosylanthranilate isomerase [Terriglobales bacterium]
MLWIKICGTTNLEDARVSIDAGADALGFIFADSPRKIALAQAQEIITQLPKGVEKIGVFVDDKPERILEVVTELGLTGVQLHGNESSIHVGALRKGTPEGTRILKAVRLNDPAAGSQLAIYGANRRLLPDAILLDSGSAEKPGGTGQTFNWRQWAGVAQQLSERMAITVGGGLTVENVAEALDILSPWGIDVVSGVEKSPGKKDHKKVRDFIAAARAADNR